jgi:hypothetical protein
MTTAATATPDTMSPDDEEDAGACVAAREAAIIRVPWATRCAAPTCAQRAAHREWCEWCDADLHARRCAEHRGRRRGCAACADVEDSEPEHDRDGRGLGSSALYADCETRRLIERGVPFRDMGVSVLALAGPAPEAAVAYETPLSDADARHQAKLLAALPEEVARPRRLNPDAAARRLAAQRARAAEEAEAAGARLDACAAAGGPDVFFNGLHFDLPALRGHYAAERVARWRAACADPIVAIERAGPPAARRRDSRLHCRPKLAELLELNHGTPKTEDGSDAPMLAATGQLERLKTYCCGDVESTRELFESGPDRLRCPIKLKKPYQTERDGRKRAIVRVYLWDARAWRRDVRRAARRRRRRLELVGCRCYRGDEPDSE